MKAVFALVVLFAAVLLAAAAGCGTVNSRIRENQRAFDSCPPEAQAQIQNGRIDRGFTRDMVYMARGEPAEKTAANRDGHVLEVWKYTRQRTTSVPGQAAGALSSPYGYPGFGPGPSQPMPMFYERSFFNVEFENGKVTGWDDLMQE